jgi:hypothetical protein
MARALCSACHSRPKEAGRHRCTACRLRTEPVDVQVAAATKRAGEIPDELTPGRVAPALWPPGSRWCGSCRSFVSLADVAAGASRCRACASAATHAAMIERTYGLTRDQYDELLALQGGVCAICRQKPGKKRLAVDHDHKTGQVRGLLCGRDNHDLLGAGYDSIPKLQAAVHYLTHPPASGIWWAPESGLEVEIRKTPRAEASGGIVIPDGITPAGGTVAPDADSPWQPAEFCQRPHFAPVGAVTEPGRKGVWKVWVEDYKGPAPF